MTRNVCKTLLEKEMKKMLLISYLDYPYPAGICTRINGLVKVLVQSGFEVTILAPIARDDARLPEKEQKNNYYIERINIRKIFSVHESNKFGKMLQWLIFSVIASLRVIRYYIKNRSLIQYQSIYSAVPTLFAKFLLRAKIIGDDIVLIHPLINTLVIKLTDVVVTPSLRTYWFARQLRKLTLYVPNGVEQTLHKRRTSDLKPNNILFVGSLSFDQNLKAVENIFKIASTLDKKSLKFTILIVGGPLSYAEHLTGHLLVRKGKIKFLGRVTNDKLIELYNSSRIGLLPFFDDTPLLGGQRTKALEFFANHLLVISGPEGVKGIHDLEPGKHYLLANSLDEMCAIVEKCLSQPEKYRKIATAGAKYISKNYSWETIAKNYVALIRSLTRKNAG